MSEDDFLHSLRDASRGLRYEPGEIVLGRIEARVRERISERETVAGTILSWMRPLAGAMLAAATLSIVTLVWLSSEPADTMLANADVSLAEDYYRVAR